MANARSNINNATVAVRRRRIARSSIGNKFSTIGDLSSELEEQSDLNKSILNLCKKIGFFADVIDKLATVSLSLISKLVYHLS